ncbi:hypothetical protein [Planobispora rosea]|uniref:hypothetical protein n=1 Tax=Planobispora rosea TaxID=35762 RepID=UPI00083B4BF2|nr:hypothetical protein [Planobispora rosea]
MPDTAPPRWKAAVSAWLGLFPLLVLAEFLLVPRLTAVPSVLRLALLSAALVAAMTYAVSPAAERLLRPWLTRSPETESS